MRQVCTAIELELADFVTPATSLPLFFLECRLWPVRQGKKCPDTDLVTMHTLPAATKQPRQVLSRNSLHELGHSGSPNHKQGWDVHQ